MQDDARESELCTLCSELHKTCFEIQDIIQTVPQDYTESSYIGVNAAQSNVQKLGILLNQSSDGIKKVKKSKTDKNEHTKSKTDGGIGGKLIGKMSNMVGVVKSTAVKMKDKISSGIGEKKDTKNSKTSHMMKNDSANGDENYVRKEKSDKKDKEKNKGSTEKKAIRVHKDNENQHTYVYKSPAKHLAATSDKLDELMKQLEEMQKKKGIKVHH